MTLRPFDWIPRKLACGGARHQVPGEGECGSRDHDGPRGAFVTWDPLSPGVGSESYSRSLR